MEQISLFAMPEIFPDKPELIMKTACFTGHRKMPDYILPRLNNAVMLEIKRLYTTEHVYKFIVGGATGFDTMVLFELIKLKRKYKNIFITLALPYLPENGHYSGLDKHVNINLVNNGQYFNGCMQIRNRFMVDHSNICIAYLVNNTGGTAYTVNYAYRKNKPVINLASCI